MTGKYSTGTEIHTRTKHVENMQGKLMGPRQTLIKQTPQKKQL